MLMKIAGGTLLVMASSKMGFDKAQGYAKRIKELQAFQSGLWGISGDIGFCLSTMDEALIKISKLIPTTVSKVFLNTGEMVRDGDTVSSAWSRALEKNKENLFLTNEDFRILYDFGNRLGTRDAESEIKAIENTIEKLKIRENDAVLCEQKYSRLAKNMGISLGIMLTLIFI